jgi:hypothetical protein
MKIALILHKARGFFYEADLYVHKIFTADALSVGHAALAQRAARRGQLALSE